MGTPYIGEIRMFGGNFAPVGWAYCSGQLQPISENDALFTLIGTTYGGDGEETFALPDLCGRVPIHQGQGPGLTNRVIGEWAGVEQVTLTTNQIPNHTHAMLATTAVGTSLSPEGRVLATAPQHARYVESADLAQTMDVQMLQPIGGSQPHDNLAPYLVITYIISLFGVFPHQ